MKGGELGRLQLRTADGLRSEVRFGAIVRKVRPRWRAGSEGKSKGVPEAAALAQNILKFIFKVGDKVSPLTEENEKVGEQRAGRWRAALRG